MKITVEIENVYEDEMVTTIIENEEVPPPLTEGDLEEWADDHLYPLTGVGRPGAAGYFVTVTACDDLALVGRRFDWGI